MDQTNGIIIRGSWEFVGEFLWPSNDIEFLPLVDTNIKHYSASCSINMSLPIFESNALINYPTKHDSRVLVWMDVTRIDVNYIYSPFLGPAKRNHSCVAARKLSPFVINFRKGYQNWTTFVRSLPAPLDETARRRMQGAISLCTAQVATLVRIWRKVFYSRICMEMKGKERKASDRNEGSGQNLSVTQILFHLTYRYIKRTSLSVTVYHHHLSYKN